MRHALAVCANSFGIFQDYILMMGDYEPEILKT